MGQGCGVNTDLGVLTEDLGFLTVLHIGVAGVVQQCCTLELCECTTGSLCRWHRSIGRQTSHRVSRPAGWCASAAPCTSPSSQTRLLMGLQGCDVHLSLP